ncbi:MAG: diaminopimelate epimerase [SAR116 cluster bacterium MED-G04]|jgi:diaminopimelate epimerase|nr:MAG: diaminopimelate epimerase [SAR116 cluster bacterium MED-G04]CAI8357806.1 MAG: Diaminopimelate epimerase [SAR116 cluster bacterium MED-G04]HCD49976.1 diaminopimelate epimerase [Alphaproteobacteria bacterium]HCV62393.1 diaminopimelate epimerase [Alphaproteobacteria bacterium]|tara:strand:- start:3103 stop:3939 length:837 start_codon:yes stop_codon:yes gene_type:complete
MELTFTKMHGIGNDVVVIDGRQRDIALTADQARLIADRNFGIGCDQIMLITASDDADIGLKIYNNDGSESGACGNGTRCVADLVLDPDDTGKLTMDSTGGMLEAWRDGAMIAVDMGVPGLNWQDIPLAHEADTLHVDLGHDGLPPAVMVNMGNPHAVHLVDDAEAIDLAVTGPVLEHHPIFPERANIEFAHPLGENRLRMRVWERGAGITIACGTGACATLVAAARRGIIGREADIVLDGGVLNITWREDDDRIIMRGPSTAVFSGSMTLPDQVRARP